MAYYCRKCHRWHKSGAIARAHTVFSARPPRSRLRPKTTQKRQARRRTQKIIKKQPILTIKKKKKPVSIKPPVKKTPLRKAKIGISKRRRGQLLMRADDLYENKMVKRLRKQTGMTHIQVMNLVNLAKKSDYIDVETEIASASGFSKQKVETYEFAKKNILKKLERSGDVRIESKYSDPSYFDNMQADYLHQLEWERQAKKFRKKANLI